MLLRVAGTATPISCDFTLSFGDHPQLHRRYWPCQIQVWRSLTAGKRSISSTLHHLLCMDGVTSSSSYPPQIQKNQETDLLVQQERIKLRREA